MSKLAQAVQARLFRFLSHPVFVRPPVVSPSAGSHEQLTRLPAQLHLSTPVVFPQLVLECKVGLFPLVFYVLLPVGPVPCLLYTSPSPRDRG